MSDFDTAVQRLTAWLRDYGPTKAKPFVDDVTIVLCAAKDTERLTRELDDARLCARVLWDYVESHDCPLIMNHWEKRWPWLVEEERP